MNLHFEAGRIAQARGWTSPEVIRAEQVDQQPPGGGPTIVVADLEYHHPGPRPHDFGVDRQRH